MATTGEEHIGDPKDTQGTADRNPTPLPLPADVPPAQELCIEETVKSIEDRIEKRSAQLKRLLTLIEGWSDADEPEDSGQLASPRSDWLRAAIESNEECARSQNKEEEKIRITKVACVHLTQEVHSDDGYITKANAIRLAKEFAGQITLLKDFLNNVLRAPLAEGIKNLQAKQSVAAQ